MKIYTLEEDHKDTTGYCVTIGVFSSEEMANFAKDKIIENSYDHEKRPDGTILEIDTSELYIYEWDLNHVNLGKEE